MQDVLNEKLTLISVNIATFSGYRRATRDHIAALGGNLPTSAAITEGSIKVFPCDGTKELQTVRRSVFRKLQAHGVRALGSQNVFAVLTTDLSEIETEIESARKEFEQNRNDLDTNYELIFQAHVAANPEAETIIRSLKVERATALSKCRFSTDVFKIAPFVRPGQSVDDGVEGMVRGLGRQLYTEIASDMLKLLKNDAFEKQRVGQKTLRPIKAAIQKMEKLAFLDDSVNSAVSFVETILATLPIEGYISGQCFATLERLVEVMSDVDDLVNAAGKVRNGIAACDVLFPQVVHAATPAPVVVAVQEVAIAIPATDAQALSAEVVPVVDVVVAPVATPADSAPLVVVLPQIHVASLLGGVPEKVIVKSSPASIPAGILKPRSAIKPNSLLF